VGALDPRLVAAGLLVTVDQLVAIFADHTVLHRPVSESWAHCPTCGHEYTASAPECPTAAVVRPLLAHRRAEGAVPPELLPALKVPARRSPRKAASDEPTLFDLAS